VVSNEDKPHKYNGIIDKKHCVPYKGEPKAITVSQSYVAITTNPGAIVLKTIEEW